AGAGAGTVFAAMYNALLASVAKARMARALSLFYGAFNGGVVAGGFLGGLVASRLGLAAPLFFLAGIAGALAIVMMRVLREPARTIPAPAESIGTLLAKPASVLPRPPWSLPSCWRCSAWRPPSPVSRRPP